MNPLVHHHFPSWNCAKFIVNPQFSDPEKGADRILPRWCMPWTRGKMKPGCSTLLVWPYLTLLTMTPTRWPLAPRRWEMGILNDGSGDTCNTQPISTNHLWYGMKWGFPNTPCLPCNWAQLISVRPCRWKPDDHWIHAEALGTRRGSGTGLWSAGQFGRPPTKHGGDRSAQRHRTGDCITEEISHWAWRARETQRQEVGMFRMFNYEL